jgi:hypothetical protein
MKYLDINIIPHTYNLHFDIDLINDKYDGYNLIELDILKSTSIIQFHGLNLNITKITLDLNTDCDLNNLSYDSQNHIYTLKIFKSHNLEIGNHFLEIGNHNLEIGKHNLENAKRNLENADHILKIGKHNLEIGNHNLEIGNHYLNINKQDDNNILNIGKHYLKIYFNNTISNQMGLTKYTYDDNTPCVYFTAFEPIHARDCFPCWDEPNFKTIYKISININDDTYTVLSNTDPINIINISPTIIKYIFGPTIPISTYVMSFVIGKFNYIEKYTNHNIRLRVYVPITKSIEMGRYALDIGSKLMDYITDYFKIPYPLNKMDFISIINVYTNGMENLGLIVYNSQILLYDQVESLLVDKIDIHRVIAHEIIHQWFGNIITMDNWKDLWLKESFATFFQYFIIDKVFPELNINSLFIYSIIRTMEIDSISYKSIVSKIAKITDIEQIYDDISYYKGSTLIYALYDYLGDELFQTNIVKYLDKFKYTTVNSELFINSIVEGLSDEKKIQIKKMINDFINNKGINMLVLNNDSYTIEKFNICKIIKDHIIPNHNSTKIIYDYIIPIRNQTNSYILSKSKTNLKICDSIIFNNKNISYLRIAYDLKQFNLIIEKLSSLNSIQHMSIFNDLFVLGSLNITKFELWIKYTNILIQHLISQNIVTNFDFKLIYLIHKTINKIKPLNIHTNSFTNYNKLLFEPLVQLLDHLNQIFDVFNIQTYTNNNLSSNMMDYNQIVLFLLDNGKEQSKIFINYLFDNEMFNLYGDLNHIIFKHIIKDGSKYNKLEQIQINYPHLKLSINQSLMFSQNDDIINQLFEDIFNSNTKNYSHKEIIKMLKFNNKFNVKFTDCFLYKYNFYIKQFPSSTMSSLRIISKLFIYQTDFNIIEKLFNKIKTIQNNKFKHIITQSKNILFGRLFTNLNINKILEQ